MEQTKRPKNPPTLLKWLGDEKGDNIAIKHGQRLFTVDKYGTLVSKRFKRNQVSSITNDIDTTQVEGLTDLKIGGTYSISQSNIVIGKILESNLFGYRFFTIDPNEEVGFVDMDYEDIIRHCQAGHVNRILLRDV